MLVFLVYSIIGLGFVLIGICVLGDLWLIRSLDVWIIGLFVALLLLDVFRFVVFVLIRAVSKFCTRFVFCLISLTSQKKTPICFPPTCFSQNREVWVFKNKGCVRRTGCKGDHGRISDLSSPLVFPQTSFAGCCF